MKRNVGGIDRMLRIGVGALLVLWAASGGPVWAWIGLLVLATGVLRFCPAYLPFGYSSCASAEKPRA